MGKDSKFVEYWVPVGFSGVQLEQYCANLFCNCASLCSPSKIDQVGSLQCVLENARKCCDHPYLVDSSLQKLSDEKIFLEVGINASGKLKLLDSMLAFMKDKGLRVLILFQNDCGPCKAEDIVDDVIRFRFGSDCYERYQGAVQPSKRQASLNKFNTKEESFIFLMEVQSCSSKIKLSNIDCVVLYGSDWNPMNDMKSLQKILVDSKADKIHVFRLFSPFTVEEKALLLSREDSSLDSKKKHLSVLANHLLLMWGSTVLYEKLAKFHTSDKSENTLFGKFQPENVYKELSAILDQNGNDFNLNKSSVIVKVEKIDYYTTDSKLPGEYHNMLRDNEPPHIFWKRLLNGKQPQWKNKFSFTSEKKRKRAHLLSLQPSTYVEHEIEKVELPIAKRFLETNEGQDELPSPLIAENSEKVPENKILYELQKNLHNLWKPEISKLCKVLNLPDNVKCMAHDFLDYVMAKRRMTVESSTIIEAFQISLCWTVASFMEFNLNHKSSLSLAKLHLNYSCRKDDTEDLFLMLKCLKRVFLSHMRDSSAEKSGLHSELNQKDLVDSIRDIEQKFSKKLSKLSKKKLNERNGILRKYDDEKQKLSTKKRSEEVIIKVTSKSLMNSSLNELMEETYRKKFWELEGESMNRLKQLEKQHHAAVSRLKSRKGDLIEGLKKWTQVELISDVMLRDLNSLTPTGKGVSKLQSDAPSIYLKAEIFTSEIDDAFAPLPAQNSQQKGLNSTAEICEEQRLPSVCTGHALNDLDVDVKPRIELPSEDNSNHNLPIAGSSQAVNADVSHKNTIIEGVSSFSVPCAIVVPNIESRLASTISNNPPILSSSQKHFATSPESPSIRASKEGILFLPASCAVVEPREEPTSSTRISNTLPTLTYSEGIDVTLPESVSAEDTNNTLPPSGVVKSREESTSACKVDAIPLHLRSSQARDAISPDTTEGPSSAGIMTNSLHLMPSQVNGATLPDLTPGGVLIEEFTNCVLAMSEKDVNQDTFNTADESFPLHVAIKAKLPKDVPVDNELNNIVASGLGETSINQQVHSHCSILSGPSLPWRQANEDHLQTPPSAQFELPARLGISTNDSQNHVSEFQSVKQRQYVSPLQIELDNIVKEKERTIRSNVDSKMRLKAECEDELTKIRRKYENMIMEADLQTFAKSKELDMNYDKVKFSMLIAEAFRAKNYRLRRRHEPRPDSVRPLLPVVQPELPRGYRSHVLRTNGNANYPDSMNDVNVSHPVDVGKVVYVSDDE